MALSFEEKLGAAGIGCWLIGILLTLAFWGLVIAAIAKYVFGW